MNGPTVNGAGTQDNDIVISGISGRFPDSNNVKELKENLFNKRDLVTGDDRRWKLDHPEIPQRTGKINNIEKFDALFFGVHFKQAHTMDPMCRMLLEHTYEAVVDAGYNPRQLRNSKTGVFIGACFSESEKTWFYEKLQVNGFGITGCSRAMLANRISYWLGVTGPSYTVDSACSSSLYALEHAYRSLKDGLCDAAIVGGANLCLHPYVSLQFSRLGVLSEDGKCKSFDADANGYTRSETVSVVFLQKAKDAKRIYATVVHARTNCDGFKEQGITFPSSAMQSALLEEFYHECGIPPSIVSFMEAHGTGTRIGDPEEVNALDKIFCKGRKGPLKIGSIKSNLGHAEPASAMNSIAKVLIAMETGYIPPNLHYNKPREGVKALEEGRIQVVTELTPWDGGYVGINSFGFGGANCHVLLKSNPKQKVNLESPADMLQRLVCVSGRTEEAVKCLIDELESRPVDVEQVALFHDIHSDDIPGHLYRGYCVIGPKGAQDPPVREIRNYLGSKQQLWFVFSGMGSQWPGMGKDLLRFPVFAAAIKKCDAVLKPRGIDIYDIITNKDKMMFENILNSFVGIAAVQIGLVDILTSVGIVPDRIIGHSVGELGCAYADGCFTAEQMVLAAYSRGLASIETDVIRGSMAAVGLGYEDLKDMCPPEIEIACHNGPESSTISGPAEDMKVFVAELQAKGIFAREVNCSNIPYHSRYIADAGPKLLAYLKKVIPDPKPRSEKWLSTSVPRDDWSKPAARLSSAEYHTNNLLSSVLFEETAALIPKDSVTIEIAPHGLLQAILRRSLPPSVINIAMTQRGHKDNVNVVLQSLGNLYTTGLHPQINKLYPEVSYPVSRGTPMISPHIRWEHSDDWYVTSYRMQEKITSGERNIEITLSDEDYEYMKGHVIDGRNLVPATGYLNLIWETVGMMKGLLFTEVSVVFEDVKFLRATTIPAQGTVALTVMVQKGTGRFEIVEGNTAVCTGKVRVTTNPDEEKINPSILNIKDEPEVMSTKDVYKELRLRGYNYSGIFCSIHSASVSASNGHLIWRNNWVSFMDNMLQMKILGRDTRGLFVPTAILKIVIDTKKHLNQIRALVSDEKLLPVHVHNHLDAVTCGGIEIRGLSANAIARRKPMGEPVLEEYTFIPHYDRAEVPLLEALQMATHIALENSLQSKMKTIELIMESDKVAPNKLASPLISEILGNLPLIQATITVVAPEGRFESGAIPENISVIEERKLAPDNSAYLVVGYNLLSRGESLKLLLTTLQEGGFILSRESKGDFNSSKIPSTLKLSLVLQKTADNENIVLLRKSEGLPKKYSVVKVVNDDFSWVSELQRVLQNEEERMGQSRTYLVGDKDFENGLLGFANCLRKESRGDSLRVVLIQDPKAPEFSLQNPLYAKQLASDLAFNVLRPGSTWGSYRHLPLAPLSPQPVHHGLVNQTTRGDISSLKWLEGPIRDNSSISGMIYIYYAACNFRDIMLASGKLGVETITKNRREEENINGLEYSGIDSSGRRLMGIITYGAMSNLCVADSHLQWEIPQSWSFEDAGTVPVVYATCVYALYLKGNMKKGDKVLIHAGTGGVGQAAINLALHEGCEVFTTVGTPEKRRFIREHFPQIPEDHIGSSRDTKFEKMILRSTKGKGVDIVLNSLSEDKLHASVRCVSARGRFLEIGKFDLAANNSLGMGIFLKEVGFHGVMLDSMFDAPAERKLVLANLMNKHLKSGAIKPLTRTIFPHDQVEQAYRYMAAGKHIGKVMLKIRDEKEPLNKPIMALPRYYCREDRSYVIFGGLGGFGLELADWLVIRGAKNLVLTSRKGVSNGYQQLRITLWRSYGVNVSILTEGEAWKRENCAKVLKKAASMAPVGGIFNLAVVLSDSLFENQTSHSFMDSFKSKVGITKQLDALSREMCPQLEQFVVFSSVSCGRGNIGQTNYGMANSVMERICERRFAEGLPGLAIQWGAVGDVGLVADMQEEHKELVIGGTLQQKITSCLQTLDHFLRQSNRPVVASMVVAEKRTSGTGSENVVDTVLNIMSIKDVKSVSHQTSLAELGMDSMMAVEIKQSLEREFGLYLTPQDIRGLNFAKLVEMDAVVAEKNKSHSAEPVHDALLGMKALVHVLENTYVTTETCVELPTEQREGRSEIYFVPGVEGLAQVFAPVVPKVKSPAVCLQLGVEHQDLDTIEKMTNKLWPDIKERTKGRRAFTLVGFSFGSIIAIELARKLEHEGMNGRLILLDGSPEHLKSVIEQHLPSSTIPETENSILVGIMDMFAPQISSELLKRIEKCTKWEEKLDIHFELLPKSPTSLSNEEMKSLCTAILKRVIAVKKYCETPRAPIRSTIILMKPSIQSVRAAPEDYGLQKLTKDKVEIHVVDGNHLTMLEADKVAAAINGDPLDDADSFKEKLMEDGALITPIDSANQSRS